MLDDLSELEQNDNHAVISTAGVDLGGLMSVLSKHLYSTPVVALRELVQNAHDSIIRRRIEDSNFADDSRITLNIDSSKGILIISDGGAGLTFDEIHQYLATVGVGYTRNLRSQNNDLDGLIGMFGLGFLSAFVLAKKVVVRTCSYQTPNITYEYQSKNAQNYIVSECEHRNVVGTDVILTLSDEFLQLASEGMLNRLLAHYCILLKEPIYIGDSDTAINPAPPPWRTDEVIHPVQLQKKRLEFAKRFETYFEPISTIAVEKTDGCDVQGLLWIQDGAFYGAADNRNLSVFVRGMLLDDDAKDLLPTWAGFIGGVIESNYLTPTASRETLQKDEYYSSVQAHITEALITGLSKISKEQPEAWRRTLLRHNEALLAASLCDDRLFNLIEESIKIPSSQGDISPKGLVTQGKKIHVMLSAESGFEDMLFRSLRIPVAYGHRYAVIPFLRKLVQKKGGTLIELGTEKGNQHFFTEDKLDDVLMTKLQSALCDDERLIAAKFLPVELPLVVVPDREAELKHKMESDEADKRISFAALNLVRQFTAKIEDRGEVRLFLNTNNPAIAHILDLLSKDKSADTALLLLKSIKSIMTACGDTNISVDLNGALNNINQIIINMQE